MNKLIAAAALCVGMAGASSPSQAEVLLDLEALGDMVVFRVCPMEGFSVLATYDRRDGGQIGRPWVADGSSVEAGANGKHFIVFGGKGVSVHDENGITFVDDKGEIRRAECNDITGQVLRTLVRAAERNEAGGQ